MLRLTEVDIDDEERPRNPHKIRSCEVLFNPFDDIIPREIKKLKKEKPEEEVKKLKPKGTKNFSLLSFGEEAEEEEEEVNRVSQSMKGKSKSSHDLLKDDPHLSSVPAVERIMNKQIRFEGFCEEITTFWTSSLSIIPYIFQELPENYLTVFVASLW